MKNEARRGQTLVITANVSLLFWTLILLLSIDNLISQFVTGMHFTPQYCVCGCVVHSGQCWHAFSNYTVYAQIDLN